MKYFTVYFLAFFQTISVFAQDFALEQLENSLRHHEWADVKSGDRNVHCFVAYPEKSENTLAVIVIHENRGLIFNENCLQQPLSLYRWLILYV